MISQKSQTSQMNEISACDKFSNKKKHTKYIERTINFLEVVRENGRDNHFCVIY